MRLRAIHHLAVFAAVLSLCMLSGAAQAQSIAPGHPDGVLVNVALLDVDSISSSEQSFTINLFLRFQWTDPNLAHTGDGTIRRPLGDIAAPRFVLLNQQRAWSSLLETVDITPSGDATLRMRLWGDFSQPLRLDNYPFDTHEFSIPILAISPDGTGIPMTANPDQASLIAEELSVADWRVSGWSALPEAVALSPNLSSPGFVFSFTAERIYNHHIIKYIIPLILIVMMSWIVFWIDPEDGASQLSVAVTAALTLIAYHIALAGKLPDIPYLTRMDQFLFGSTMMVFLALLEVVVTSKLAKGANQRVADWLDVGCRVVFPASFLLITEKTLGLSVLIEAFGG